jgi:protoporphyrinogen oxidase
VFERAPAVGGLIASFDFDGITLERYYHFLCKGDAGYFALCEDLGISDRLRWVKSTTGFYYNGDTYRFTSPLDLMRFKHLSLFERIRFGLFALESQIREEWVQLDEMAAKPWLVDRIGSKAYEMIWHPLLAFKFGDRHEDLSAAWVWHRVHRVAKSKGWMGYLEGGSAFLLDTLTARIRNEGVEIHEGSAIRTIEADDDGVKGLAFDDGSSYACDHVVSTAPLPVLAELLPEHWRAYGDTLREVDYIGVVCAVFKLRRPVTSHFWLNINDPRMGCNGIIEFTNLNPLMGDDGAIVYVPYYSATDKPIFQAADDDIFEQSWEMLKSINGDLCDADLMSWRVFRARHAQAVCPAGFLKTQPAADAPLKGLHLLDSTFLYPEDRTQGGLISLAQACADRIGPA